MNNTSKEFRSIKKALLNEITEEKSVFITHVSYVENEEDALLFIEKIKDKHKDANHNCYAYIIGTKSKVKRYQDDGEPTGSAGLPMLSVLEKEDVTNLVCVVTRYFGGKLLGKSNLIRTYSRAVSETLTNNIFYKREYFVVELIHSYNLLGIIENFLAKSKIKIIDKNYTDIVKEEVYVRYDKYDWFRKEITNLTSSNIEINIKETKMIFD